MEGRSVTPTRAASMYLLASRRHGKVTWQTGEKPEVKAEPCQALRLKSLSRREIHLKSVTMDVFVFFFLLFVF